MAEYEQMNKELIDFYKFLKKEKQVNVELEKSTVFDYGLTLIVRDATSDELFTIAISQWDDIIENKWLVSCSIAYNDTIGKSESWFWGDLIAYLGGLEFEGFKNKPLKGYKGVNYEYDISSAKDLKYVINGLKLVFKTNGGRTHFVIESKKGIRKNLKESISTELSAYLQGEMKKLGYFIDDLNERPTKRNAKEVLRTTISVKEFCESYIRELEKMIKNNEV